MWGVQPVTAVWALIQCGWRRASLHAQASQCLSFPPSLADARLFPSNSYPFPSEELANGTDGEPGLATAQNRVPLGGDLDVALEEATPSAQRDGVSEPTLAPSAGTKQPFPPKKKPPSAEQGNTVRKHLRPKTTPPGIQKAASPPTLPGLGTFTSTEEPRALGEVVTVASGAKQDTPEPPPWDARQAGGGTTSPSPLQISPFTPQPSVPQTGPPSPEAGALAAAAAGGHSAPFDAAATQTNSVESEANGSAAEESQETTTSTIITTTVITTEPTPGRSLGRDLERHVGRLHKKPRVLFPRTRDGLNGRKVFFGQLLACFAGSWSGPSSTPSCVS